jgi:pilus assembly protein CpaB
MLLRLGLALGLSLLAGALLFQWMAGRRAPVAAPVQKAEVARQAVAAVRDLPRGSKLTLDMLTLSPFAPEALPAQSFALVAELEGRVLASAVLKGEAVPAAKLAPEGVKSAGVAALISPGKRAMAVKGNKVMGLSGFIRPGSMVDVLVSLEVGGGEQKSMAKMVLANVPVLATGNELEYDLKSDKPSPVEVYTLEVTPEQSEVLALASTKGELYFALRGGEDAAPALTPGVDVAGTLASNSPARSRPAPGRPAPRAAGMQVITGSKMGTVNF